MPSNIDDDARRFALAVMQSVPLRAQALFTMALVDHLARTGQRELVVRALGQAVAYQALAQADAEDAAEAAQAWLAHVVEDHRC